MTARRGPIFLRSYGTVGPTVIVLHGGPAAAGNAAPLARGLSQWFQVLEPWQRGSSAEPLTVARHVEDLHEIMETRCVIGSPALVGESWGAMLALAYAAAHPNDVGPIVLVGCGTFDTRARARLEANVESRIDDTLRRKLDDLRKEITDPGERLESMYALTKPLYLFDPLPSNDDDVVTFDARAHTESWEDMVRLQVEGVYPAAFSAITSPVLMLHGAYDPHPGDLIRASLEPSIEKLEYREWERCGHSPWLEREVRDEFFDVMRNWLLEHLAES